MFNQESINFLKYIAAFGVLLTLTACSDDGVSIVFDPDVAPQNVQVVSGDGSSSEVQNTISWTRDTAATDYVVYVSNTPGVTDSSTEVDSTASGFDWVTHSGMDVVAGTALYYRVQAISGTLTSILSDEVTGTPQETVTGNQLNDVAWNGTNTLVTVGDSGMILNSPNGLTSGWTAATSGVSVSLAGVTWENVNHQFLVVGAGGTVLSSPDANSWSLQPTPDATDLEDVAWLGNSYIAVGKNGTILISDGTGSTWTKKTTPSTVTTVTLEGVATNGSRIIVVGTNGSMLASTDGDTWSEVDLGSENNGLNDVTWDGNRFIVVGSNDTILTSPDGNIWTSQSPGTPDITFVGVTQWDSSLPTNPLTGAVGSAGTFVVSPGAIDGISIDTGTNQQLSGMTWVDDGTSPGYFVIVGNDGTVLTSQQQ